MNENTEIHFQKVCRTCVMEKKSLQTIFHVVDMLRECTSIEVDKGDGLPEWICLDCVDRLNNAFKFRKQCEFSDKRLREINIVVKTTDVKTETKILFNDNGQPLLDNIDNIGIDIKSESSYNKNDLDLNDSYNRVQSDLDSEDEPLIKRLHNRNKIDTSSFNKEINSFTTVNVKSEKVDFILNETLNTVKNDEDVKPLINTRKKNKLKPKEKVAEKDGIPCTKCNKCFELESDLEIHMITHQQSKELICTKCSKTFEHIKNLRKHVPTHMINKPYRCTFCPKSFAGAGDRNRHIRTHTGEKPMVCSVCGVCFTDSSGLSSHMRRHSNIKKFACTICPKSFTHRFALRQHINTHTGEKPYLCTVCGKGFTQSFHVTKHMRTHTGELPFPCTKCDKKFRLHEHLKMHDRTHTGIKPYACKICEKEFARPESLTIHNRSHTGERPYACNICEKRYISASTLAQHRRAHNKQKTENEKFMSAFLLQNMSFGTDVGI